MNETGQACAHLHVFYRTKEHEDRTMSGWWECRDCQARFAHEPARDNVSTPGRAGERVRITQKAETLLALCCLWCEATLDECADPAAHRDLVADRLEGFETMVTAMEEKLKALEARVVRVREAGKVEHFQRVWMGPWCQCSISTKGKCDCGAFDHNIQVDAAAKEEDPT